jgi:hypothetical protein
MEEIIFVRSVDCRACAFEMRDAPKRKLERIIGERKMCRKCQQCERLQEAEQSIKK